jgi:hypothetical protein
VSIAVCGMGLYRVCVSKMQYRDGNIKNSRKHLVRLADIDKIFFDVGDFLRKRFKINL